MKNILLVVLCVVVAIVVGFWLLIAMVKLALKLIGLALIVGLGAALYFGVKNRIVGSDPR
jgi:hypothetical protein